MHIEPYLFFDGRCEEAYRVLQEDARRDGREHRPLQGQSGTGQQHDAAGSDNKIMHASFRVGDSRINCSDGMCQGKPVFQGVSLVIEDEDRRRGRTRVQRAVGSGAVHQPLIQTFFSSRFGMLADGFGVAWMIMTAKPSA